MREAGRANPLFDLSRAREAVAFGVLREEQLAIDGHVEDAAASCFQLGVNAQSLLQFGRQTGSRGLVVSNRAVLDVDLHMSTLSPVVYCFTSE